jgi:hypothetical protein
VSSTSHLYPWVCRKGRQIFSMHFSKWNRVEIQTLFCRYDASKGNSGWPAAKIHGGCREFQGFRVFGLEFLNVFVEGT